MKTKKLKLEELNIESFVTESELENKNTIQGGMMSGTPECMEWVCNWYRKKTLAAPPTSQQISITWRGSVIIGTFATAVHNSINYDNDKNWSVYIVDHWIYKTKVC